MGSRQYDHLFKILMVGDSDVGKTSILLRYIRGEYDDRQVSTLQASYLDKKITVNGKWHDLTQVCTCHYCWSLLSWP